MLVAISKGAVSIEDTKERLDNIKGIDKELQTMKEANFLMWNRLASIGAATWSDMNVSGGKTITPEDRLVEYIDRSKELQLMEDQLNREKMKLILDIQHLEDRRYRLVLMQYYILGKTWDQVAEAIDYGKRHVQKLHIEAINELCEIVK